MIRLPDAPQPFETHRRVSGPAKFPVPVFLGLVIKGHAPDIDHANHHHQSAEAASQPHNNPCGLRHLKARSAADSAKATGEQNLTRAHETGQAQSDSSEEESNSLPSISLSVFDGNTTLINHSENISLDGVKFNKDGSVRGAFPFVNEATATLYSKCPVISFVVDWIRRYSRTQNYKVVAVGLTADLEVSTHGESQPTTQRLDRYQGEPPQSAQQGQDTPRKHSDDASSAISAPASPSPATIGGSVPTARSPPSARDEPSYYGNPHASATTDPQFLPRSPGLDPVVISKTETPSPRVQEIAKEEAQSMASTAQPPPSRLNARANCRLRRVGRFYEALASAIWLELDAVPLFLRGSGDTADEQASSAARKAAQSFSLGTVPTMRLLIVKPHNEVAVDFERTVKLCNLPVYRRWAEDAEAKRLFRTLEAQCQRFGERRMLFFNSTPQGGGVAIMRHGLLRLFRSLGVKAHWFVPRPKPAVFQITKKKFHNVLQGVAGQSSAPKPRCSAQHTDGTSARCSRCTSSQSADEDDANADQYRLQDEDKQLWEKWCLSNLEEYWEEPIRSADFIVIDDPQLCAMIPAIKQRNPHCKIAFRSHIQINTELLEKDPNSIHAETWNYLWSFIRHADIFVFHPLHIMVPKNVPADRTVFMPATTDPLDGLNKGLSDWSVNYYQRAFCRLVCDQHDCSVDFSGHKYIIQIARFDPSKGIPDLLESFRLFSEKLRLQNPSKPDSHTDDASHSSTEGPAASASTSSGQSCSQSKDDLTSNAHPRLLICGHSAVDDPEALSVYEDTLHLLDSDRYESIRQYVCVARLPPSDQLLNALLRGARCAMQLSIREGFEIKITEALMKGVPVIAYRSGGIPLQIRHGSTGFLVDVGDYHQVAEHMYQLYSDDALHAQMSEEARKVANRSVQCTPLGEAVGWLRVAEALIDNKQVDWNCRNVAAVEQE